MEFKRGDKIHHEDWNNNEFIHINVCVRFHNKPGYFAIIGKDERGSKINLLVDAFELEEYYIKIN